MGRSPDDGHARRPQRVRLPVEHLPADPVRDGPRLPRLPPLGERGQLLVVHLGVGHVLGDEHRVLGGVLPPGSAAVGRFIPESKRGVNRVKND